jgi:hypothetical protein
MGLTIHYCFAAPEQDSGKIKKLMLEFHKCTDSMPFQTVGRVMHLRGEQCRYNRRDQDDPMSWLLIQCQQHVELETKQGSIYTIIPPTQAICFHTWPGRGCEAANFGLCQYPAKVRTSFGVEETKLEGWKWKSFCKTQYASAPQFGGLANFLKCHLLVIAMLDEAKKLGFLERASDESDYWNTRDMSCLVGSIDEYNKLMAVFGGTMKDSRNDIVAPITEFINFEKLEAEGWEKLSPEMRGLAELIKKLGSK